MSEKIIEMSLSTLTEEKFIDYAREVIEDRALPDARDGLKPVQRRILWSMYQSGYLPNSKFKKCARIVGDVMGKYHPHGDSSVYGALVKLQQPFVRRNPLIEGHGNFGTIDDNPAAMRYTEARLAGDSMYLLTNIKKDPIDFVFNYDDSEKEPEVLPARFPNLLVNGASGIAVGTASEIPSHNLIEVINGVKAYINNKKISTKEMMEHIKAPDFNNGGIIDPENLLKAYKTGRGCIKLRSNVVIENVPGGKKNVVIKSIPYQTSKEIILKKIERYVERKEISEVLEIRDESTEEIGVRLIVEVKDTLDVETFIEGLYKKTDIEKNYHFNMVALVNKKPVTMGLLQIVKVFTEHRVEVFKRITKHEIKNAKERLHVLKGLEIAVENLDEIIKLIKKSRTRQSAKNKLIKNYKLSEIQANAILNMKLSKLTNTEVKTLKEEIKSLIDFIKEKEEILKSDKKIEKEIIKDLDLILEEKKADTRIATIKSFSNISHKVKTETFTLQAVKGKYHKRDKYYSGDRGQYTRVESSEMVYSFMKNGKCRKFPANLVYKKKEDSPIVAILSETQLRESKHLLLATKDGMIGKTDIEEFLQSEGLFDCIRLRKDDRLINVVTNTEEDEAVMISSKKIIRFLTTDVRSSGMYSYGVIGINLEGEDKVIGFNTKKKDEKMIKIEDFKFNANKYSIQNRGGKGRIFREKRK
jgi:DNA gyrase subunit A